MIWLDAVVNEVLGINGPVPDFIRMSNDNIKLGRIMFPKGSFVTVSPILLHYKK